MLLMSAYSETSYPTFSNDNMHSNSTFLHTNYIIHSQKLSILYNIHICIEVTSIFSDKYNILLVICIPTYKPSLH